MIQNEIENLGLVEYSVDLNLPFLVEKGQRVKVGDRLCEGSVDLKKLLEVSGISVVRNYIVQEVQKVY